jgi:hypothetical protein
MVQYCAALTYWQLGRKGDAVGWLGKAVRGGYPVAWLRDSPVFRDWHEEEGFRALIASADPEPQPAASGSQGGSR